MHQYSNHEWTFTEQSMIATAVYCIRIDEIAGKARS
jgi:hypothetical protein